MKEIKSILLKDKFKLKSFSISNETKEIEYGFIYSDIELVSDYVSLEGISLFHNSKPQLDSFLIKTVCHLENKNKFSLKSDILLSSDSKVVKFQNSNIHKHNYYKISLHFLI